ncbi:hypothetical protein ETB97_011440 [Aspergillus alliaceus]|uniref:beta-glucosidase n=1 Tax=Petromyces alliaceus TaxID=209559 RepID=A0A8H6AGX4_PETAA|nr:hypothetical protein ETB97_011440 [Aspergillus burnettii]
MVGKWHLGESVDSQPTGFDYWSVLPGQGHYWDPDFTEPDGEHIEPGYVTDIITNKSLNWIKTRDRNHPVSLPDTFSDNYKNRAKAGKVAKMRVAEDFTYQDLGLVQPDGGRRVGEPGIQEKGNSERKIPAPTTDVELWSMRVIGKDDGTGFTFQSHPELVEFKFQRYMQRYLHAIQSVDDNVGRMHNDVIHHAYANYGIRNQTYKLIYWYNEPLGVKGARSGGEEHKEWELFDCEQYPLELFNVYHERDYQQVAREMTALLEKKMVEIRDEHVHPQQQWLLASLWISFITIDNVFLKILVFSLSNSISSNSTRATTHEGKVGQMGGIRRLLSLGPKINEGKYDTQQEKYQNGNIGFGATLNWANESLPLTNEARLRQTNESQLRIPFITVTDSINNFICQRTSLGAQTMEHTDESGNIKVAMTIKHFFYGDIRGGVNAASIYGGINHIYNDKLRPYIRALEAEPAAVMVSYASVDLVPMSANLYLVRDILRRKLGFDGVVLSDAKSVAHLCTETKVASSYAEATLLALKARLQMELSPGLPAVFPNLVLAAADTHVGDLIDEGCVENP